MTRLAPPVFLFFAAVGVFAAPPSVNTNHPFSFGYYVSTSAALNNNLNDYFNIPNPASTNVYFSNAVLANCSLGNFFIQLFPEQAPRMVANFLQYVTNGRYQNMLIQRSDPGFVIQMGGVTFNQNASQGNYFTPIPTYSPVPAEVNLSNTTGTIAMALGSDSNNNYLTNSGTSQWFVNLTNNVSNSANNLDPYFTVFGKISTQGLAVMNGIANFNTANLSSYNGNLSTVPLHGWQGGTNEIYLSDFVTINMIATTPYFAVSSDPSSFKVTLKGPSMSVNFVKYPTNLATTQDFVRIYAYASDTNGNVAGSSFIVVPYPPASQKITFPRIPQQVLTTNQFTLQSLLTNTPSSSSGLPLNFTCSGVLGTSNNLLYYKGTGTATITATSPTNSPYYYYYQSAPRVTVSFLVKSNSQTIDSFSRIPDSPYGQNIQIFPPAATSSLPVSITVKSGPAKLAGTLNGNVLLTPTGVGTVTVAANQGGNPQYIPAPEVTTQFLIVKGTPTITFTPITNAPAVPRKTFHLSATSSANLPITFSSSSTNVISVKGSTATILSLGSTTITATSPSTSNWNSISSNQVISFQ